MSRVFVVNVVTQAARVSSSHVNRVLGRRYTMVTTRPLCGVPLCAAHRSQVTLTPQNRVCTPGPDTVSLPFFCLLRVNPLLHTPQRFYAKGKNRGNKGKDHKKKGQKVHVDSAELDEVIDSRKMKASYEAQVDHLRRLLSEQLSLRTNSLGAFDNIMISTSDGEFPLIQLGHVSQKGKTSIVIDLASSPQYIPAVKTILMDRMALNPQQDGTKLFVNIPKVTREHREELADTARKMINSTKLKLQEVRAKYHKQVKKVEDQHPIDLVHKVDDYILEEMRKYVTEAEQLVDVKVKELVGE